MRCQFCNTVIQTDRNAYQRVIGWTRRRDGGGANQITLRETIDQFACSYCIERLRNGVAPGQEALI